MTGAAILLLLAGLTWFLVPFGIRKRGEATLDARCRERRAIVLTYDDGPGAELTESLRRLLGQSGIKATFFVLGRNADARPAIVARLLEDGHEVGSHTQAHSNAWRSDPVTFGRDVAAGIRTVAGFGGNASLFRPPNGKLTLGGLLGGLLRGLRFGWWTIDSGDSWARRPIDEVIAEIDSKGGGVVLMHDFDDYDSGPDTAAVSHREHVLALTERIITFARTGGYQIVPLSTLLKKKI